MTLEQHAALNPKWDCRDCGAFATLDACSNCFKPICNECQVRCAGCDDFKRSPWCATCALNRGGFEKRDGKYFCQNCPLPENVLTEGDVIK